jgi:hypothetical protein
MEILIDYNNKTVFVVKSRQISEIDFYHREQNETKMPTSKATVLFTWVWNVVSRSKGRKEIESVWEQSAVKVFRLRKDEVTMEWK